MIQDFFSVQMIASLGGDVNEAVGFVSFILSYQLERGVKEQKEFEQSRCRPCGVVYISHGGGDCY